MLIPGCGKGYDVALFAAHGYDAYGLEVSTHAAEAARKYLEDAGKGPLEGEYSVNDEKIGRGATKIVCGDFFEDEWFKDIDGWEGDEGFDIIYDITVSSIHGIVDYLPMTGLNIIHSSCAHFRFRSVQSGRRATPVSSAIRQRTRSPPVAF